MSGHLWLLYQEGNPMCQVAEQLPAERLVGKSAAFREIVEKLSIIAHCPSTVLISGETGTGKELFARRIHALSPRSDKPFIPVNCGAVPAELVENELFGHARGAFTCANDSARGLIREAEGGTLFLDEVHCLPLAAQVKLLRFLQEKTYRPLGSTKELRSDIRIISAMNVDPEEAVRSGKLRRDFYYRLNVISLKLPPLRKRREDIPLLAEHFLQEHSRGLNRGPREFSPQALQKLMLYDWPGNVRELEHIVEQTVVFSFKPIIKDVDISLPVDQRREAHRPEPFKEAKERSIAQFERSYIRTLLILYGGNISKAARAAQKHRRAFWELIRKHQIDVQGFR